ncbi:MAG: multicopper oxidase domain-containing protein [Betaproteobacteria bacterium]|nr:multicopper oxidase domain-containing protein [Betaproteobacteria bacterium]
MRVVSAIAVMLLSLLPLLPVAALAEQREFSMTIEEVSISVAPGFNAHVFAFNGQVPGPLIHIKEGDEVTVHVTNNTTLPHTIHWHGINQTGTWRNDGVPAVTQPAIEPGDTFDYHWKADRPGSLWYHCHVNVWEHVAIRGMWGPLIVDPKVPTPAEKTVTRDVIMMMNTWESSYASTYGKGGGPTDVSDYFSVNAKSFPLSQPIRVKTGDVLRIRMFGAGDEIHEMHLHGHDQLLSFKDGYALPNPYFVDTVPVGPGERFDTIVSMNNPGRFIFHDHVDRHLNMGGMLGGPITVIEYDGIPMDSWYPWKDKVYDPDFFYSESMKKGYGLFENPNFKGAAIQQRSGRRVD